MEKEAFYFPHFCNARHDRKIRRLRKELGLEGYGIYFMLLETLREQHDLMYPMDDVDLLAEEFGTSEQKLRTTICNYDLFDIDESNKFFSPRLIIYLEPYFRMKEQRMLAGRASAEKRKLNIRSTAVEQSKVKESKVNEIKVKESNSIAERKQQFYNSLIDYQDQLGSEFENFFNYWAEPSKSGKMRFEMEKFFDISRRIGTWNANASKYKGKHEANFNSIKKVNDDLINDIKNGTFYNPFSTENLSKFD